MKATLHIIWRGSRAFFAHVLPFAALMVAAAPRPVSAAPPDGGLEEARAKPGRVVSVDLCSDMLVLKLASRGRVASVSHLAADTAISTVVEEARGLPLNDGAVEEIARFDPDLVVALDSYPAAKVNLLKSFGIEPVLIVSPASFDDVRRDIRLVAAALGEAARGEAMITTMDKRLAAVAARRPDHPPLAVVYGPAGSTSGLGTMVDEILRLSGWRNMAAEMGIHMWGNISLEPVLARAPDAVILDYQDYGGLSLAEGLLEHPSLRRMGEAGRVIRVPSGYWLCASPAVADAAEILSAEARRIAGLGQRP